MTSPYRAPIVVEALRPTWRERARSSVVLSSLAAFFSFGFVVASAATYRRDDPSGRQMNCAVRRGEEAHQLVDFPVLHLEVPPPRWVTIDGDATGQSWCRCKLGGEQIGGLCWSWLDEAGACP